MSHPESSIADRAFRTVMGAVAKNGATHNERRIAGLLLDVYDATSTDPKVVAIVNRFASESLEGTR